MSHDRTSGRFCYHSQELLEPLSDTTQMHPGSRYASGLRGNAYVRAWYRPLVERSVRVDWSATCRPDAVADLSRSLPFEPNSFDTIPASDVFEHLPDMAPAFTECARILRPAGTLVVGAPFLYMVHEEPHYSRPTTYLLDRLAGDTGLTTVQIDPVGGAPDVPADLLSTFLARGNRSCGLTYRAARTFCGLPPITRLTDQTSVRFPLGYLDVFRKPVKPVSRNSTSVDE